MQTANLRMVDRYFGHREAKYTQEILRSQHSHELTEDINDKYFLMVRIETYSLRQRLIECNGVVRDWVQSCVANDKPRS